jgi:hypothetical protein
MSQEVLELTMQWSRQRGTPIKDTEWVVDSGEEVAGARDGVWWRLSFVASINETDWDCLVMRGATGDATVCVGPVIEQYLALSGQPPSALAEALTQVLDRIVEGRLLITHDPVRGRRDTFLGQPPPGFLQYYVEARSLWDLRLRHRVASLLRHGLKRPLNKQED